MIDRSNRLKLAEAVHSLIAGYVTTDQFTDWLLSNGFYMFSDPRLYADAAIGPIVERSWCLYSDLHEYRLKGGNRLSTDARKEVLRWIIFLQSELEYEWPTYRFINPALLAFSGCLFSILTFGMWERFVSKEPSNRFLKSGDFDVWPFLRQRDFEFAYSPTCPFSGLLAA